ncbi:MAG: PP2C family protein-serine/threonine phosphatase [Spirochaetota bacterium]
MTEEQKKGIKASRPSNIVRVLASILFMYLYFKNIPSHSYIPFFHIVPSLAWWFIVEFKYSIYEKYSKLWYIASVLDVFMVSAFVFLTGAMYSSAIMGYVIVTALSSADLNKNRGLFAVYFGLLNYLVLILLTYWNVIPLISVTASSSTFYPEFLPSLVSFLLIALGSISVNAMIYTIYIQLHGKNTELLDSLQKINQLKLKQDGDYFLTSLLIEPLTVNLVQSELVKVNFRMRQKTRFPFKKYIVEIGGDICIADSIVLQGEEYTVFINADAMGKSIQGAGGVLVLGTVYNAYINRTKLSEEIQKYSPESWLLDCFNEIHTLFLSFDGSMYISGILGILNDRTGKMHYVNAEHPFTILYRDGKASFLESEIVTRKMGTPFIETITEYYTTVLQPRDILILGSDGKDDWVMKQDDGSSKIDSELEKFLDVVEKKDANLDKIFNYMTSGDFLSDDLSIMKLEYLGKEQEHFYSSSD